MVCSVNWCLVHERAVFGPYYRNCVKPASSCAYETRDYVAQVTNAGVFVCFKKSVFVLIVMRLVTAWF